jgi:hypothetical protein
MAKKGPPKKRDYKAENAKRDYKAEHARRKARASRKRPGWTPERLAKFQATMARKHIVKRGKNQARDERVAERRAAKLALLNGRPVRQVGRPRKDQRPSSVTVLEADGTLATYVLTTVQAYVSQPG